MHSGLKRLFGVFLVMAFPCALAHLDSVRIMVSFPNLAQQGFKLSAVGTSSGLKITGAKLSVLIEKPGTTTEIPFTETQAGIYEITQPLTPGKYNFKFIDKTFPNESLEYSINAALPRPINQSTLMFVWPPTRGSSVSNLWLVLLIAPVGLMLMLGAFGINFRNKKNQNLESYKA